MDRKADSLLTTVVRRWDGEVHIWEDSDVLPEVDVLVWEIRAGDVHQLVDFRHHRYVDIDRYHNGTRWVYHLYQWRELAVDGDRYLFGDEVAEDQTRV